MNEATTTTRKHKFHAGQRCRITRGPYAGKSGVIMFDEPIVGCQYGDEWFVEIGGRRMGHEIRDRDMEPVEEEAARPEPAASKPEPFPAGARIRHTLLGRTGTVQQVQDATWRIARFDGDGKPWLCSVDYLEELPEVAECEPAVHRWAAGDWARIDQPSHAHHGSDVVLARRQPGIIVQKPYWEYKTIDGFDLELGVYEEYLVPVPESQPEPDARRWVTGDRVRLNDSHTLSGRAGTIDFQKSDRPGLPRLVRLDDFGCTWARDDQMEPESAPASPPAPQPPTLYRVEYLEADADGDPVARRAALIPVAGVADRLRWAEILEILTGYAGDGGDSDDKFAVAQLGGIPADPYAVGDRVAIVGGEHHGQAFYLVERDAANGQRWWLSRRRDGDGWIGLHVDRFERDERGDQ